MLTAMLLLCAGGAAVLMAGRPQTVRAQGAAAQATALVSKGLAPELTYAAQEQTSRDGVGGAARALQRSFSLELTGVGLEKALWEIARQSGLGLSYNPGLIPERRVSVGLEHGTVAEALGAVLAGTQLEAVLSRTGEIVVVEASGRKVQARGLEALPAPKKIAALALELARGSQVQTGTIEGTVTAEATGEPIPGANVTVEGTQQGAATGPEGEYEIPGVEVGTYTVRASFIGYGDETQEGVEVNEGQTTTVDIVMQQEAAGLDEVVVVGYGQQQRRDLTGSVSSISTDDLETAPPSSIDQALQGRVAGVQVTQNSSKPGSGTSVRIRGTGSVQSGAEPLYVIDGVPVYTNELPGAGTVSPNPLAAINPQDIESIEVLKDASATAIYGARGANGVVLVSTKQGRSGETQVNFSSHIGSNRIANPYDLLNASQYATYVNEVATQAGGAPYFENPDALGEGTDWQDVVYDGSSMTQNYQLSARGGGEATNFALSGNFYDEDGIVEGSSFRRYSFRTNFDRDVSDRFRVGSNVSVSRSLYNQVPSEEFDALGGVVGGALVFPPFVSPRDEEGNYTTARGAAQEVSSRMSMAIISNPLAQLREVSDETHINRVLGNAYAEFDILENLYVRTSFGADIEDISREAYTTRLIPENDTQGSANTNSVQRRNFLSENLLKYNATLSGAHALDLTAGFTWQNETTESQFISNSQFVNDITRTDDIGAGNQEGGANVGSSAGEWTLLSYLGRVNYTYNDRYLLTLTGRYDGSSKFGAGNKWGFFPSGALAWRVIEEPFMQDQDLFSNFKVRVSYGWAGNQEIGTYAPLAQLNTVDYSLLGQSVTGFEPGRIANPDLKWETSRQLDVGMDVGFAGQRLRLTADFYRKTTEDLILPVTLPLESGFDAAVQNTGSVRNTGFEVSLEADLLTGEGRGFAWSTNFNAATNRNEVIDLGESSEFFGPGLEGGINAFGYGSLVREGEPVGAFFGFETDGVFDTQEEAEAYESQPGAQAGDLKFVDTNGDGTISDLDRIVQGSPYPDVTFGWTNRFSYAGLSLSVFLQGSQGSEVTNLSLGRLGFRGENTNRYLSRFEDRWTPDNRDAAFPRAGYTPSGDRLRNDYLVQDASFIRLKNVTLSYNLPMDRLGISGVRSARLYVQGRDLLTFTDYLGYNPDVSSKGQSLINRGYDLNAYPFARKYTVGIDLSF